MKVLKISEHIQLWQVKLKVYWYARLFGCFKDTDLTRSVCMLSFKSADKLSFIISENSEKQ